jgi:hypothetical protein
LILGCFHLKVLFQSMVGPHSAVVGGNRAAAVAFAATGRDWTASGAQIGTVFVLENRWLGGWRFALESPGADIGIEKSGVDDFSCDIPTPCARRDFQLGSHCYHNPVSHQQGGVVNGYSGTNDDLGTH